MESSTPENQKRVIGKPAVALGATFLTLPAFIPFYFALGEQDPSTFWLLIAVGISIIVGNAIALILIYRWILRLTHE
ncbi:MAG: hypothetical protein R3E66_19370 [bacterium]